MAVTIGVLALQGGFQEHLNLLKRAAQDLTTEASDGLDFIDFIEVRTPTELARCTALVIPGGESTTLSLLASQSGLLEPLREFVNIQRRPTWGTCAGLIFLAKEASATKLGGQELIGGLDVRVHRNHFGRQRESFVIDMNLDFLNAGTQSSNMAGGPPVPFLAVFIRAPVVETILASGDPADVPNWSTPNGAETDGLKPVEILATLPGRHASNNADMLGESSMASPNGLGDIVALRQGNIFGTSFHPELTDDIRVHKWWLEQALGSAAS